jgi:hypothetical protein
MLEVLRQSAAPSNLGWQVGFNMLWFLFGQIFVADLEMLLQMPTNQQMFCLEVILSVNDGHQGLFPVTYLSGRFKIASLARIFEYVIGFHVYRNIVWDSNLPLVHIAVN